MDFIDFINSLDCIYDGTGNQQDYLDYFINLIISKTVNADSNDKFDEKCHQFTKTSQKTAVSGFFSKTRPFSPKYLKFIVKHYDASRLCDKLYKLDYDQQCIVQESFARFDIKLNLDYFVDEVINTLNVILGIKKNEKTNNETNQTVVVMQGNKNYYIEHVENLN